MWHKLRPRTVTEVKIEGLSQPALVHKDGFLIYGNDGKAVSWNTDIILFGSCGSRNG